MKKENRGPEEILDQAIHEISSEPIDPKAEREAAARVWARISAPSGVETIRSCADFQALIPEWRDGRLVEGRRLLVEDHLHECPACRRAFEAARKPKVVSLPASPARRFAPRYWAIAASLVAAAGLGALLTYNRLAKAPDGSRAVVQAIDGALYRVSGDAGASLATGAAIGERELVRTAKGSHAVLRLRDGSVVEMAERTDVALTERAEGATIHLNAGHIIVQAAKQHSRHLYVATEDCKISVTGTVFSVNHGMKGSRVSVVEGEVQVAYAGRTDILHRGEQLSTSESLASVPVNEEIAWSRNVDSYIALLGDITSLRRKLEAIPGPAPRYSSRLIDLAPADAALYVAIPNLGTALGEAQRVVNEALGESAALREWWASHKQGGGQSAMNEGLERIRALSEYLGPEVVVAMAPGEKPRPVVLAEVTRTGFRSALEAEIKRAGGVRVNIVDDASAIPAAPAPETLYVYLANQIVAISPDAAELREAAALAKAPNAGQFARTAFGMRVADAYRTGAAWLVCADLQALLNGKKDAAATAAGLSDVRYLVVERKDVGGRTEHRAVVSFADARKGVASWLGAPAAIRGLDFVSPEASFATAAVIKNPGLVVDELFGMLAAGNPEFWKRLAEFEAKAGIDVRADFARPLGGEVVFAVDGAVLPVPSWKLAVEVYDPARLQQAIEKLALTANQEAQAHGVAAGLHVEKETVAGRTFYAVRGAKAGFEAHYTYVDGFLLAGPSRELVVRAMQGRQSSYTLARSAKFGALLPHDGHTNFSAAVYQSAGNILNPLAEGVKGAVALTPEQQKKLDAIAASAAPSLVLAYGGQDRIEVASAGSLFGLNLENMLMPNFMPKMTSRK